MEPRGFPAFGTVSIHPRQYERFKSGELWKSWRAQHRDLFDEHDEQEVRSQAHLGRHFFEWMAAVLIFNATGSRSLQSKYDLGAAGARIRKRPTFERLAGPEVIEKFEAARRAQRERGDRRPGCPDLLVYDDDGQWFFVEVKGPDDDWQPDQAEWFEEIAGIFERPVYLLQFRWSESRKEWAKRINGNATETRRTDQ